MLLTKLWGDVSTLAHEFPVAATQAAPGVAAAVDVLKTIFSAACLGAPIELGVYASCKRYRCPPT